MLKLTQFRPSSAWVVFNPDHRDATFTLFMTQTGRCVNRVTFNPDTAVCIHTTNSQHGSCAAPARCGDFSRSQGIATRRAVGCKHISNISLHVGLSHFLLIFMKYRKSIERLLLTFSTSTLYMYTNSSAVCHVYCIPHVLYTPCTVNHMFDLCTCVKFPQFRATQLNPDRQ